MHGFKLCRTQVCVRAFLEQSRYESEDSFKAVKIQIAFSNDFIVAVDDSFLSNVNLKIVDSERASTWIGVDRIVRMVGVHAYLESD